MTVIDSIVVLAHPRRPESIAIAHQVADHTRDCGLRVHLQETWEEESEVAHLVSEAQLVVAIGGDGAMLQSARLCAPLDVPVFGLNMGYLGFLTEASPEKWVECLDRILKGEYWIEKRMMITGEVWRDGERLWSEDALNDVVVSRGAVAKTIHLEAYINGEWATNYNADGLVIATPTGSTAYALASGGPILPPELENLVIVPVAPHLSMERPVVLSQGATVTVVISPRTQTEITVTIDGHTFTQVNKGDEVRVRAGKNYSSFLRLQGRNYFFRSLMDRMEPRFLPKTPPKSKPVGA